MELVTIPLSQRMRSSPVTLIQALSRGWVAAPLKRVANWRSRAVEGVSG